jgi:acetyltransferase
LFRSVDNLLRPRTVAVVGASESGGAGWPRSIYANFEHAEFPVRVYLINPRREELWGQKVYPDFASIPEPVDLALSIIPAEAMADTLREGVANGLKAALVFAARFGEGGDATGEARARAIRELCDTGGLRVCGPNCMGAISFREKLLFYPSPRVRGLPAGPVGVVFQSGGTFQYWLHQAAVRGLGYSYAVSSGNELDLDLADYINFMVEDEHTRLIACMVEGIRRPDAFMAVAEKALAAGKPIILVKVGASERGSQATISHTGALAGNDDVFNAVCRKYGIIRCPSLDDMIETCLAFQAGRIPNGNAAAMAGYSGGATGLFLDYAEMEGLRLAELSEDTKAKIEPFLFPGLHAVNPLDTGAGLAGQPDKFSEVCRIMAADPAVDMISVQGQLPAAAGERTGPEHFAAVAAAGKPIVAHGRMSQNVTEAGLEFQNESGVPFLQGLPEVVRALKALGDYGECTRRGVRPLPPPAGSSDAFEADRLDGTLNAHGLTPPRSVLATTPDEASKAARGLGFPVAVKAVTPDAIHKTELGALALGLADADAVRAAAEEIGDRLAAADVPLDGFLVQEMVSGLEVIAGVREDEQYGPVMVVGLGGVFVEAIGDVALRLLPVDARDAREMLDELRGKALLGAFRGAPPRDVDALAQAVAGLSELYLDHRHHLTDLEINPLMVLAEGEGVRAVDVRPVRRREGG